MGCARGRWDITYAYDIIILFLGAIQHPINASSIPHPGFRGVLEHEELREAGPCDHLTRPRVYHESLRRAMRLYHVGHGLAVLRPRGRGQDQVECEHLDVLGRKGWPQHRLDAAVQVTGPCGIARFAEQRGRTRPEQGADVLACGWKPRSGLDEHGGEC